MADHIIDPDKAAQLEDPARYRYVSREELCSPLSPDDTVMDIGSGTGFFTDDIAAYVSTVYAVDMQPAMHSFYRDKGVPDNVELVEARASDLDQTSVDAITAIFSLHEIDIEASLERFTDLVTDEGKLIIYDWSKHGSADDGPPLDKRYTAATASDIISSYFTVEATEERIDTFKIIASP